MPAVGFRDGDALGQIGTHPALSIDEFLGLEQHLDCHRLWHDDDAVYVAKDEIIRMAEPFLLSITLHAIII